MGSALIPSDVKIHSVRDVAPKKPMLCLSFRAPDAAAATAASSTATGAVASAEAPGVVEPVGRSSLSPSAVAVEVGVDESVAAAREVPSEAGFDNRDSLAVERGDSGGNDGLDDVDGGVAKKPRVANSLIDSW